MILLILMMHTTRPDIELRTNNHRCSFVIPSRNIRNRNIFLFKYYFEPVLLRCKRAAYWNVLNNLKSRPAASARKIGICVRPRRMLTGPLAPS